MPVALGAALAAAASKMIAAAVPSIAGAAAPALLGSGLQGLFSAAAAERERAWSEKMYNQYNSPAALVRQYQQAGINPALMFGQSTPAAAMTSSQAAMPSNPVGDLVGVLGQLMNLSLLGEQKENIAADTRNKNASAASSELDTRLNEQFAVLERSYNIAEVIARINKLESEFETTDYERRVIGPLRETLLRAQSRGENVRAAIDEWKKAYMDKYNADPDADPLKQALSSFLEDLNNPKRSKRREKRRERAMDNRRDDGWTNTD